MFLNQIVLLFRFIVSFYHFVLSLRLDSGWSKMKSFHFKTRDARTAETFESIAEGFESTDTSLRNITTASFCSVDTSEKIFEVVIDVKVDIAEIDIAAKEIDVRVVLTAKNVAIIVSGFEKRFDFLFCYWLDSIAAINFFEVEIDEAIIVNVFEKRSDFFARVISSVKSLSGSVTVFCITFS